MANNGKTIKYSAYHLKLMSINLVFAAVFVALTLGVTSTLFNFPMASAQDDPRADIACEKVDDNEVRQDAKTYYDSDFPASDKGIEKANEGPDKALSDCGFQ